MNRFHELQQMNIKCPICGCYTNSDSSIGRQNKNRDKYSYRYYGCKHCEIAITIRGNNDVCNNNDKHRLNKPIGV